MARPASPCATPGCPEIATHGSRCPEHTRAQRQAADARRPTAAARGYTSHGHRAFRRAVLARDPWCTCPGCTSCHQTAGSPCLRDSTDADHFPATRRQLIARGANPNDPDHGRGLCHPCHSHHTASHDGGFGNQPRR